MAINAKILNVQYLPHQIRFILRSDGGEIIEHAMNKEQCVEFLATLLKEHQEKFPDEWNPDGTPRGT